MGIGDRDYMRGPDRGGLFDADWKLRILLAGVLGFVLTRFVPRGLVDDLVLSGDAFFSGRLWTPFTAPFIHGSVGEAIFTLYGWFLFGGMVEETLPPRTLLRFAWMSVLVGWLAYLVLSVVQVGGGRPVWGYHGLVAAALAFAVLRYPHRKILLFFLLPVPMWLLGGLYFLAELSGVASPDVGGADASSAVPLAAAAFGVWAHFRGVPNLPWGGGRKPSRSGASSRGEPGKLLSSQRPGDEQERVDRLLDKISKDGIGSLTPEERDFLDRASKRYR